MTELQANFNIFKDAFKNSAEFKRYQTAKENLHKYPEKWRRVQELRTKNYRLQNSKEQVDLFIETERLEQEYADVYTDPITQEYLMAEVAICKIIQKANLQMVEMLDFDDIIVEEAEIV